MKTLLNTNLFMIVLFSFITSFSTLLKASTNADTNEYKFKTQTSTTQASDCSTHIVKPDLSNSELESKTTQALNRINNEGILECNNLNQNEQSKCLKVLDVAREMIKLAHQKQFKHIACR